jgi:hypothetical protein
MHAARQPKERDMNASKRDARFASLGAWDNSMMFVAGAGD